MLLLEVVLAVFALVVAWRMIAAILNLAAAVVRGLIALIIVCGPSLLAGLGAHAFAVHDPQLEPGMTTLLAAGATLPLGLLMAVGWLRQREAEPLTTAPPRQVFAPSAPKSEADPEPAHDCLVRDAWRTALRLAPDRARELRTARAACAGLLVAADGNAVSWEVVDAAAPIRRVVPELVSATERLCATAGADERAQAVAAMVAALQQLAGEAEGAGERERRHLRERLALLRAHVANLAARRRSAV